VKFNICTNHIKCQRTIYKYLHIYICFGCHEVTLCKISCLQQKVHKFSYIRWARDIITQKFKIKTKSRLITYKCVGPLLTVARGTSIQKHKINIRRAKTTRHFDITKCIGNEQFMEPHTHTQMSINLASCCVDTYKPQHNVSITFFIELCSARSPKSIKSARGRCKHYHCNIRVDVGSACVDIRQYYSLTEILI